MTLLSDSEVVVHCERIGWSCKRKSVRKSAMRMLRVMPMADMDTFEEQLQKEGALLMYVRNTSPLESASLLIE